MSCNNCNSITPSCGCTDPCTPNNCGCAVKVEDKCVTVTVDLECASIERGKTLDKVLIDLDQYLCDLLDIIQNTGSIQIANVGGEVEVYKGISGLGVREFRTFVSDTLVITQNTDTISIEQVDITGILQYIVNNTYTGDEELGTVIKPFKTIANALTAFVGSGTADAPENQNATIIIQKGDPYTFTGNFTYRNLNVIIEEDTVVNHSPVSGAWLADYNALTEIKSDLNIVINSGATLTMNQKGFRNRGSLGGAAQRKQISITGTGTLRLTGSKAAGYTMFDANYANEAGYTMPAFQNFTVGGINVHAVEKDIYNVGINTTVVFSDCNLRHSDVGSTIDVASEVFDQKGGSVSLNNCELSINATRTNCFTISKEVSSVSILSLNFCKLLFPGTITNFFTRKGTNNPTIECQYFTTTINIPLTNIFNIESGGVWTEVYFRYNIFSGGAVGNDSGGVPTTVDLTNGNTRSVNNLIGGQNIDSLVTYGSRALAAVALESGSKFLNTNSANVDTDTWFIDIVI